MAERSAALDVRHAVRRALEPRRANADGAQADPRRSPGGASVLVALSGGADSLALLAAAVAEVPTAGAVVVDHGLQDDSAAVAARAADAARGLGASTVDVVRVEVGGRGGPESAARDARYRALADAAGQRGFDAVLLGHTRDDQAETVLLRLSRGSGSRSLAGMPRAFDCHGVRFVRPLLDVPRATTHAACAELGLEPWIDPHNADPAYLRARVRSEVVPVLVEVLGDGAVAALARSADLLRDDDAALDDWALRVLALARRDDEPAGIDVELLEPLPAAVRRRVLRRAALDASVPAGSLTAAHLASIDELISRWHGQGEVALPGPVHAARSCGRLTFRGR